MTTPEQAEQLWSDLRDAFAQVETIIARIIETRAWEPLGYATFTEAWADRMPNVEVRTTEGKASIVYAMVDDGTSDAVIARSVRGLGPQSVKTLRRQKGNGVPAPYATIVRQHYRKSPGAARSVHVMLSDRDYGAFVRLAEQKGLTVPKCAEVAILAYLDRGER